MTARRDNDAWLDFQDRRDQHDERLDRQDRLAERGSVPFYTIALADREARLRRRDEREARRRLYPDRPVTSQVTPLGRRAA